MTGSRPSEKTGEFTINLGRVMKPWVWAVTILAPLLLLIVYMARLPTLDNVKEIVRTNYVSQVQFTEVPTRKTVRDMLRRHCVSREEYAETKGKIRANTKLLKRIDKNVDRLLTLKWRLRK